jgi:hypothetical protein
MPARRRRAAAGGLDPSRAPRYRDSTAPAASGQAIRFDTPAIGPHFARLGASGRSRY